MTTLNFDDLKKKQQQKKTKQKKNIFLSHPKLWWSHLCGQCTYSSLYQIVWCLILEGSLLQNLWPLIILDI